MYELPKDNPAGLFFLSVAETAKVLDLTPRRVYQLLQEGELESVEVCRDGRGIGVLVRRASVTGLLERWNAEHREQQRKAKALLKALEKFNTKGGDDGSCAR